MLFQKQASVRIATVTSPFFNRYLCCSIIRIEKGAEGERKVQGRNKSDIQRPQSSEWHWWPIWSSKIRVIWDLENINTQEFYPLIHMLHLILKRKGYFPLSTRLQEDIECKCCAWLLTGFCKAGLTSTLMKLGPRIWEAPLQLIWATVSLNLKSRRGTATSNKASGRTVRTSNREEHHFGLSC